MSYIVISAYAVFLTFNMVTYSSTNFSSSTVNSFYTQDDFYYPVNNWSGAAGFNFAFGLLDFNLMKVADIEKYMHLTVVQVAYLAQHPLDKKFSVVDSSWSTVDGFTFTRNIGFH